MCYADGEHGGQAGANHKWISWCMDCHWFIAYTSRILPALELIKNKPWGMLAFVI